MKTKLLTLLFVIVAGAGTICATEGALPGLFSVSADKKVQFSQGNLQYQASTDTWRFAENQYDIIGEANANISASYSGWIDLFGWGTGNNPTLFAQDNNDYSTFVDWGVNAISNGGNEANIWRTLTYDEWVYLFQTRDNASALYGHSTVNGTTGMVILPDDWQNVAGIAFTSGIGDFSQNTYTSEQWSLLESVGAVFLPTAGYRISTNMYDVGVGGSFWSATPNETYAAYRFRFDSSGIDPQGNHSYRYCGRSVRLIQDAPCILASGACGAQGDNLTWELSCDSVLTITGSGAMAYLNIENEYRESIRSVIIGDGVTSIGKYAFYQCSGLTTVTIGNNVTDIGNAAFAECTSLISVTIPNSVTSIGGSAFLGVGLTSVTIPNSVTSIGEYAFASCTSLISVTIPNSVTSIGESAFEYCTSLTSVTIPNSVTSIGKNAFYGCSGLTSVTIGNGVTSIGYSAFSGCRGLTSLTIPNSVTHIGTATFDFCNGLTSLTIGNSVTVIEYNAFQYCTGLTSITCTAVNPPTLWSSVFLGIDMSIPLYVPSGSIAAYQAAYQWNEFTNIQAIPGTEILDPGHPLNPGNYRVTLTVDDETEGSVTGSGMYSHGSEATLTATPNDGYEFVSWSDGVTDNPRTITVMLDTTIGTVWRKLPKPTLVLEPSASQCFPASAIDVAYAATDADSLIYSVKHGDDVMVDATKIKISASGMFTINVEGFAAGEYTIEAYATSALGYVSDTVAQTFSIYGAMNVDESATICEGDSLLWNGQWLRNAATYYDTVKYTGTLCDSVYYTLNLSVAEKYEFEETYPILETELPYTVHGCIYTEAGTFDCGFTTVNGCDSIYHITIVVLTTGEDSLSVDGVISAEDLDLGVNSAVTINPEGHLVVSSLVYVQKLTLDYSDAHHAQVTGIGNIHADVVEILLNFPTPMGSVVGHWFSFAVPFEVSVATGIRLAGSDTPARYGYDFVIDEFDGMQRATIQQGWKRVGADAILRPGQMYMLAGTGGLSWVLTATDPSEIIEHTETDISENSSAIGANHSGWNGIANPMFANATADMSGVTLITTYNNVLGVYETCEVSEFVFMPSTPFFVQVAESAKFGFNDIPLYAPRRAKADNEPSVFTKLMLTDADEIYTDKAYISFVTDKEEDTYLIGHDLQKMAANSQYVHQLWLEAYGMQLSAYEAPLGDEPRSIPIGIYAPAAGNYTLQMSNVPENISISLTENGQPVWDIAASAYTLNLPAGNSNSYALYVQRVQEVVTDYMTTNAESTVQKVILDGKIYILRGGKTYTVQGQEVK